MAAHFDTKVCPHAGGVGLGEYVRHLAMIDYVCFAGTLEGRICESTTHLHEFFEDPVTFTGGNGDMMYDAPGFPGFAKFHDSALGEWVWPHGTGWANEAHVSRPKTPGHPHSSRDMYQILGSASNIAFGQTPDITRTPVCCLYCSTGAREICICAARVTLLLQTVSQSDIPLSNVLTEGWEIRWARS
jgi:hypothetical protein